MGHYGAKAAVKRNLDRVAAGIWKLTDEWGDADTAFWGKSIRTDSMEIEIVQRGEDKPLKIAIHPIRAGRIVPQQAEQSTIDTSADWVQPFLWESPYTSDEDVDKQFRHYVQDNPDVNE